LITSQHFCGLISILFAAVITSNPEGAIDMRAGREGVGLGKRDSVPEKQILPNVEPMVLAEHHPKIAAVFPHI